MLILQFVQPFHHAVVHADQAIFPLLIPLAVEAAKGIYGAIQSSKANNALDKLNSQPREKYLTGEEVYDRANSKATGLSPQELAAANSRLTQLANTRYQLGVQKNPNLGSAVQAGVNYGSIQGALGLAAQDAAARRQSLMSLMGVIGNQSNRQVGSDLAYRDKMETTYGNAAVAGVKNVFGALEGGAGMLYNDNLNNKYMDAYSKLGLPPPRRGGAGFGASTENGWGDNLPT